VPILWKSRKQIKIITRKVIFYSKDPGEREGTRLNKNSPPMPLV
jgi:hypothetical protein